MFTHVYAALVAVINTKFPQTGELIVKRLVSQFRKGYRRNDKVSKNKLHKPLKHVSVYEWSVIITASTDLIVEISQLLLQT